MAVSEGRDQRWEGNDLSVWVLLRRGASDGDAFVEFKKFADVLFLGENVLV